MTKKRFIEFDEFIRATFSAKAGDFGGRKETRVTSEKEFKKMRDYVLALYQGVTATHSFVNEAGQYVDCIPFEQQPSLRGSKSKLEEAYRHLASPPSLPFPDRAKNDTAMLTGPQIGLGRKDEFGNDIACPEGSIPMRRITLELLTRFKKLSDFFAKPPPPGQPGRRPPPSGKEPDEGFRQWGNGFYIVDNWGAISNISVWKPKLLPGNVFSLSQIWVEGEDPVIPESRQTIEMGWEVYPEMYETDWPCLFVFFTPDDFATAYFNLEGEKFVQRSKDYSLGNALPTYSQPGGYQFTFNAAIAFYETLAAWYLWINGQILGYYPLSVFNEGLLTKKSTRLQFGGEVNYDFTPYPQMGSGLFAQRGGTYAAYQSGIQYLGTDGVIHQPQLNPQETDLNNFAALVISESDQTQKIYFGGPGYLYLAYRRTGDDMDLCTAYYDGSQWYGNTKIKDQPGEIKPRSSENPAAVTYMSLLCLAYKGDDSDDLSTAYFDGQTWRGNKRIKDQPGGISPRSCKAPAAAVYPVGANVRLYLAYRGATREDLFTAYYENGKWYGDEEIKKQPGEIDARSDRAPALALYQNKLYVVYKEPGSGTKALRTAYFDGDQWHGNTKIEDQPGNVKAESQISPTACAYKVGNDERLYVIYQGDPIAVPVECYAIYFDGTQWQGPYFIVSSTNPAPTAVVYNTQLYSAYRAAIKDSDLSTFYFDGTNWNGYQKIKDQPPVGIDPESPYNPGMAVF